MKSLDFLKEVEKRLSKDKLNGIEAYLETAFDDDNHRIIPKSNEIDSLTEFIDLTEKITKKLIANNELNEFAYKGFQQRHLAVKRLAYLAYKKSNYFENGKGNKTFIQECHEQRFFPVFVNALHYEGNQGYLESITVTFSTSKPSEGCILEFKHDDAFKVAADKAIASVKKILSQEEQEKLNASTIIFHLNDFYGSSFYDRPFYGKSIGIAMAAAVYFNLKLYSCSSSDHRDHLRKVFENELEEIAFTGEIDNGKIKRIDGFEQKAKAAELMGMRRVFCPAENKKDASSEKAAIIPVNSLEQAIALVRYGQYLEKIKEDTTKMPLFFIEERDFFKAQNPQYGAPPAMQAAPEKLESIKRLVKQPEVLEELDTGLLVTGDGGMGKSTFLRYLRRHYAAQILDGQPIEEFKNTIKIPVFIDLRGYKKDTGIKSLLGGSIEKVSEDYKYLLPGDIEQELKAGRFLLLCDGIDGIDRIDWEALDETEKEIGGLKESYPDNFFVFTSRENVHLGYITHLQNMELAELKQEDIEAIIDKAFKDDKERGDRFKTMLEQHPSGIEGNPFFLSLMLEDVKRCSDADINISHFRNKGKLFERIVAARYKKDSIGEKMLTTTKDEKLIKAFKEFMPGLATWLMMKNKTSFTENDIDCYSDETKRDATDFKSCLQNPTIIPLLEMISKDHWGFIHDRFLEYFAAVHQKDEFLKILSDTGRQPTPALVDYLQEYINKTRWEDVNLLTVGLLVDCEVERGRIHCKCNQSGFFCEPPLKDDSSCRRFSAIKETYSLVGRRP